jgi:radical SAM superfamily enzyme YgiQ (UPF0313 family)
VLAAMNKGFDASAIRAGLELCRAAEIPVSAFLIVGHPGDSVAEATTTRDLVRRLFDDHLLTWIDPAQFVPYPGTPIFARLEQFGVEILSWDWRLWHRNARPIAQLTSFSADEIQLAYLRLLAMEAEAYSQNGPPSAPARAP